MVDRSLTEIFGMRIVPITPPPESNRLRYSASAELALAEPASAEPASAPVPAPL